MKENVKKDLKLNCEIVEFKDKNTGEIKHYNRYFVDCNDIKIVVETKKGDYTGRQVLDSYFK